MTRFRRWGVGLVASVLVASAPSAWADKVALLIGVGQYPNLSEKAQLQGPPHDVAALRDVLVRRWGFTASGIRSLVDAEATRAAIMAGLRGLTARSKVGDEVLIYFSGHGTSAADAANKFALPHSTGGFLPYDMDGRKPNPETQLIVGRTDLVPIIKALEDGGRKVLFITDSCFSQFAVRSGGQRLPARMVPLMKDTADGVLRESLDRVSTARPDPYPYRATATLAASAEAEVARDIPAALLPVFPTLSGKPHGAFTDALLRVLEGQLPADANGDGVIDLVEAHTAIARFMASRAYGQAPQRLPSVFDDSAGLGRRALLSPQAGASAPSKRQDTAPQLLRVYADDDESETPPPVMQMLRRLAGIQLVRSSREAEIRLRLRSVNLGVANSPKELALLSAADDTISTFTLTDLTRLEQQISQLAWARRIQQLAQQHRRAALPWAYEPEQRGGNFFIGDMIQFLARPDRDGWLLLLNIDSKGEITVLYPGSASETAPLRGSEAALIPPGSKIRVGEPLGMDMQFAFVFDEKPVGLDRLMGYGPQPPSDPRWATLGQMIEQYSGKFSFNVSDLRVYPARARR